MLKGKDVVQIIYINSIQQVGQNYFEIEHFENEQQAFICKTGNAEVFQIPGCLFTVLPNFHCFLSSLSHSRAKLLKSSCSMTMLYPSPKGRCMQFFCCTIRYFEETSEESVSTSENHSVSNTTSLVLSIFCSNALFQNNKKA